MDLCSGQTFDVPLLLADGRFDSFNSMDAEQRVLLKLLKKLRLNSSVGYRRLRMKDDLRVLSGKSAPKILIQTSRDIYKVPIPQCIVVG